MKINPISIYKNFLAPDSKLNQTFGQSEVTNPDKVEQIPQASFDYSVRVPMAYKFIEEIELPNNLKAHCYKLANGQRVVIVPKNGETIVQTYVNTGSFNEPDNLRGISHYIEHNLFNGSEALADKVFFDEVNKMGASTNASTSFSVTDYYIDSHLLDDGDLENKIKLHAGMIETPKFLDDKLVKEKDIVNSEINMCLSNESSRAESITLKNLFNIKSIAPDLVAGSTDNIDALTREDVVNYFDNNYYPANMVTVITGEVEPEKTIALVSKYFHSMKTPTQSRHHEQLIPIYKPVRQDIISNKKQGLAEIYMGFAGPENSNAKDKVYLRAVETLLLGLANSRAKNLRQKYDAEAGISTERLGTRPEDKTAKIIGIDVSDIEVETVLKEMYSAIEGLYNNPPTEDEFQAVKNKIKKENDIYMQCSSALNYHIGMDFLNSNPYGTRDYNAILDGMTYDDFIKTAKKYLDLNKVAITVVHPAGTTTKKVQENYKKENKNVSFTGLNKKTPLDLNRVSEYKMPNNYDVVLHDEDTDVVNYSLLLDTNSWTPHKAAAADILQEILNNGSMYKSKDTMNSLLDKFGIAGSIIVTNRAILLNFDFPVENINESVNLLHEKVYCPKFSEKDFTQALFRCLMRYTSIEPSANEKFDKAMYKNTDLSVTNKEKIENIVDVTLDDVRQLYYEILSKAQGRIVVTGPFSKNPNLKQMVFNNTASLKPVQPKNTELFKSYEPIENTQVYTVETKRNQAEILEGFKFKQSGNMKDYLCFSLLNNILGNGPSSRLFNDLREQRHLCYSVSSSFDTVNDIGAFKLEIATTTNNIENGTTSYDNIKKSIDGFNENIEQIKNEKVSDEELEHAKRSLKSQILTNFEMNDDKNSILLHDSGTPYGLNYINEQMAMIDEITKDDILNAAKYVFSSKPVYSLAATKDALAANENYLANL